MSEVVRDTVEEKLNAPGTVSKLNQQNVFMDGIVPKGSWAGEVRNISAVVLLIFAGPLGHAFRLVKIPLAPFVLTSLAPPLPAGFIR